MKTYLDLLREVLEHGAPRSDRTGTGTRSLFGRQIRFDLGAGFPLLTTKKLHIRSIVHELLWFLRGDKHRLSAPQRVGIWTNGRRGRRAGAGLWATVARLARWRWRHDRPDRRVIEQIRSSPDSRRLIVSAWNVGELPRMALPPCHVLFQFHVADGRLSCQLYQRSADIFLGVPFNIASYALLTHLVAQVTGLDAGEFVHTFGDVHLYANHVRQAREQLAREPRPLPRLCLAPEIRDLDAFAFEHIRFENYHPHPAIRAPVAV